MKYLPQAHHAGHGAGPGEHWQTYPVKGMNMEMTYVGGMAGWIHKGELSRYVGGTAGWIHKGQPSRYVGGTAGRVSYQAVASAAPEPRYVLAS